VLFFAALWYFFIAVMKPFGSLSRMMRTREAALKAALLPELDARIEDLAAQIRAGADASKMADLFEETVELIERRREVCNPTELPIGSVGRRMLSLGTLLPFVPFAIKVALPEMKSLADFIGLILSPSGAEVSCLRAASYRP
jgi:hypothetical protein